MDKIKFDTEKDWMGKGLLFGPTLMITTITILRYTEIIRWEDFIPINDLLIMTGFFWFFVLITWNFTYYILDETSLTARMSYIWKKKIKLSDIKEMKRQKLRPFIYGLSSNVLSIKLKNGTELNITPKQTDELINEINKRRQDIKS